MSWLSNTWKGANGNPSKTKITGLTTIVGAFAGFFTHAIDLQTAIQLLVLGVMGGNIKDAVDKTAPKGTDANP
jgi:hypothetical protein